MAFSQGNSGNAFGGAPGAGGLNSGPDLETIQTEALGFLSIAGDAKLRLTSSWTSLPSATASLLSIASRKGLVAAAGPEQVIIASTEAVRKAFEAPKDGDSDIRSFSPQLTIPMPMRVSQLAFTADENYLILSAETGGGLAVYEVQSLLQGSTNTAFELPTNGEPLRALIPNPTVEKTELCAIITNGGNLHMANLKERRISNPLKAQVSCLSWSSKGKQLCAGLADGTIHQLTPEGEGKGDIPKPPNLGNCHVSSLTWLENNLFLAIHTTTNETPPASIYHIITRQPPSSFQYRKLTDPVDPFGSEKIPHHSLLRLRDFAPALSDLLIVTSTASTEVGLLTRSKTALATDKPADSITNVFTTTELLDDTRRPTLPMTDAMEDSTPIGIELDLSSREKVYKPIPSDEELEDSPGPLPGLWVLTHEGVLCSWWLVYTDSIRQGTTYSGLAAIEGPPAASTLAQAAPIATASPFSKPNAPTFASAATPSAFGAPSQLGQTASSFGGASQLGQKPSPWASAASSTAPSKTGGATFGSSTFGSGAASQSPAFGQPSALGFGQSAQVGAKPSPWGSVAGSAGSGATSGQSGFAGFAKSTQSPFGSAATDTNQSTPPATSGFAGFAKQGGFGSVGGNTTSSSVFGGGANATSGGSIFGAPSKTAGSAFGSSSTTTGSVFGGAKPADNPFARSSTADTAFPPKQDNKPAGGTFGSTPFKLGTTFKADPSVAEEAGKPAASSGSLFGNAFGSALSDAQKQPAAPTPPSKEEDMDVIESVEQTPQAKPKQSLFAAQSSPESTTPTTTPAPSRYSLATSPAPGTSLFGQPTSLSRPGSIFDRPADSSTSTGFGSPSIFSKPQAFGKASEPETPKALQEADAPLPPDATSKVAYPLGDSSSSSAASVAPSQPFGATTTTSKPESSLFSSSFKTAPKTATVPEDAPLPPDFTKAKKPDDAPLPPDFTRPSKPAEKTPEDAPLPPDFLRPSKPAVPDAPLPPNPFLRTIKSESTPPLHPSFIAPKAPSKETSAIPSVPDSESDESDAEDEDEDEDEGEDAQGEDEQGSEESESGSEDASEGSGIDVAKDLSPSTTGFTQTPGFTPQSSFGGFGGRTLAPAQPAQSGNRVLFGEVARNAPTFARPTATSPRSPSPVRGAIPNRMLRSESTRSVSAPGMASSILGPRGSQSQFGGSSITSKAQQSNAEDPLLQQHRRLREQKEAEESQPLVDEEDDDLQKILASEVEGTLELDEFVAHSNVSPPAQLKVPAQVEAVYRDINSMIDTLGLNSRAVKAFVKGHTENAKQGGRTQDDLEIPDDWVLCEVNELGAVLDNELYPDLEDSRVQDLDDKLDACQEMAREMHRLRAKQEDLRRVIMARMDPNQAEMTRSLPLSAEQAAQQNELRREFTNFTKQLAEAEKALTMLKTGLASASSASGKGGANVPTVEAVMRTIAKMTSMVEKRSGDVDVLENQLRKLRLEPTSREGSPMVTPQRRSVMFSPESTPTRNFRNSLGSNIAPFGSPARATPPRRKLSGFSKEEKGDLMEKRSRRQAVLSKLKESVEKRGVSVWNMEDIE